MAQLSREENTERLLIRHISRGEAAASFADDVRRGLTASPKHLFPKYLYDELGSQLFESICLLPEYYLTRAENEIFARHADEIVAAALEGSTHASLVELGSGSATKTRLIIESLLKRQPALTYTPVDISPAALETSARVLLQSFPDLRVNAYAGDYDSAIPRLRENLDGDARVLALFLGSNVGNFDREEARGFLLALRGALRTGDALLLGADLKKDAATLEAAYDDALGVTAAFNLNLLARVNREFEADFDLRAFKHVAVYNEPRGRVELYMESAREQVVRVRALDLTLHFDAGERMHTENSHKYDLAELSRLAEATGFTRAQTWLDSARQFSSNLFLAVEKD
ncbi:MAG: L-histidine N(alpha)-methyltransferase [Pyrinomonadaceae bacterium]